MSFTIKIGVLQFSPEQIMQIFRTDADYRREQRVHPGQEIMDLRKGLNEFTAGYIGQVQNKIDQRAIVSAADIENVRTLERLQLNAARDYKGDHFSKLNRDFEKGVGVPVVPEWKKLELRAGQAGLLSDYNGEVRIKATHNRAELTSRLQ